MPVEEFLTHLKTEYRDRYWHVLPRDMARWWALNYGIEDARNHRVPGNGKTIWIDLA